MTDSAVPVPTEVSDNLRWLRIARAAAVCSLSLFLIAVTLTTFLYARQSGDANLPFVVLTTLLWLPYLWMLLQMLAKTARSRKKGLALAIAYGVWALLIAGSCVLASESLGWRAGFAIFSLVQVALIVSAMQTYRVLEKEPGDKRILVNRIFVVSAWLGILCLAAICIPSVVNSKVGANESSAISSLHTIDTAQFSYAGKYPQKGFAAALSELGPPPGAGFIDEQLASGTKFGYSFSLIASPPDASGRIAQYTVTARPLTFGQTGKQSLFVDASGVIRSTAEDRAATAQDPPVD